MKRPKRPPEIDEIARKWTARAYTPDGEPFTCIVNADVAILLAEYDRLTARVAELEAAMASMNGKAI